MIEPLKKRENGLMQRTVRKMWVGWDHMYG
jgi:hypothetical protein